MSSTSSIPERRHRAWAVLAVSLTAAIGAAALLGAAPSVAAPRAERYVAPPPDTSWSNRVQSSGSFGQGEAMQAHRAGVREWGGERLASIEGPNGTLLLRPNGEWVAIVDAQGEALVRWDPPYGWAFPLEVGKSWTRASTMLQRGGGEQRFTADCRVEAHGDVTVPAGTIAAFRVDCRTTAGVDSETWFAPQLGIFVRHVVTRTAASGGEGRQVTELASHSGR
jgi:hypothetical protein